MQVVTHSSSFAILRGITLFVLSTRFIWGVYGRTNRCDIWKSCDICANKELVHWVLSSDITVTMWAVAGPIAAHSIHLVNEPWNISRYLFPFVDSGMVPLNQNLRLTKVHWHSFMNCIFPCFFCPSMRSVMGSALLCNGFCGLEALMQRQLAEQVYVECHGLNTPMQCPQAQYCSCGVSLAWLQHTYAVTTGSTHPCGCCGLSTPIRRDGLTIFYLVRSRGG